MVADSPWLSTLCDWADVCVTLVFCQGLVGLPSWGCDASGCLGPAVFMVFAMGSPVSGRDCVLPQSSIVTKTSLLLVGLVPGLSAGSPASGWRCVFRHALVLVAISYVFLRDVVTLWVNSVFLSLLIAAEGLRCWVSFPI